MNLLKKIFFVVVFFTTPLFSSAATLHFEPQTSVLGTQDNFSIVVLLDADKSINTIEVSILFPKTLEPKDVEIGESIINLWIDKPTWNENTRTLNFSGLIPGGIEGTDMPLITVDCNVSDSGSSATVSFDPTNSYAYLSDGKATQDNLIFQNLVLPVANGKENFSPNIPDTTSPEAFTPEISRSADIFDNQWFLSFSTEDKGSGMASYEVREKKLGILGFLTYSPWQSVESPYLLHDQSLRSEIDVKAIDKDGNERLEIVPARFPVHLYENTELWIIIILAFLLYAFIRFSKRRKFF